MSPDEMEDDDVDANIMRYNSDLNDDFETTS
jgi:hypothetical protein